MGQRWLPMGTASTCAKLNPIGVDCLLVNTGCSLVAVLVDMDNKRQCPNSPLKAGQCSSFLVQRFATGIVEEQADESGELNKLLHCTYHLLHPPRSAIVTQPHPTCGGIQG